MKKEIFKEINLWTMLGILLKEKEKDACIEIMN